MARRLARIGFAGAAVFGLLLGPIGGVSAAEPIDPVDNSVAFRTAWRLDASRDHIRDVLEDPANSDNEWEMPLLDSEAAQIVHQEDLQGRDDEAVAFARALPDFAGVYIDHQKGARLVVLTTEAMTDGQLAHIRGMVPDEQGVFNHIAVHSRDELDAVQADVEQRLDDGGLEGVTGLGISNRLAVVEVYADGEHIDGVRSSLADLGDAIKVTRDDGAVEAACVSRDDCEANPWRGGIRIDDPDDIVNHPCSAGFVVFSSLNNKCLLSAGHCLNIDSWKHGPASPRTTVGDTTRIHYVNNGSSDVELINITSWDDDHVIFKSNDAMAWDIDDEQLNSQEVEGQHVCKTGYRTKTSCAAIDKEDFISTETMCPTTCKTLKHMTKAIIYQVHPAETWGIYKGDSGGAVWFPTYIEYAAGIISRQADNHTYFVYSHISYALNDLDDSAIPDLRTCVEDDSWTIC